MARWLVVLLLAVLVVVAGIGGPGKARASPTTAMRLSDGVIHVWYHHLLVGQLRSDPALGRNLTVQPFVQPDHKAGRGATQDAMAARRAGLKCHLLRA